MDFSRDGELSDEADLVHMGPLTRGAATDLALMPDGVEYLSCLVMSWISFKNFVACPYSIANSNRCVLLQQVRISASFPILARTCCTLNCYGELQGGMHQTEGVFTLSYLGFTSG